MLRRLFLPAGFGWRFQFTFWVRKYVLNTELFRWGVKTGWEVTHMAPSSPDSAIYSRRNWYCLNWQWLWLHPNARTCILYSMHFVACEKSSASEYCSMHSVVRKSFPNAYYRQSEPRTTLRYPTMRPESGNKRRRDGWPDTTNSGFLFMCVCVCVQ